MVERLCEQEKLDVNLQNNDGNTPLHLAVQAGKTDVVESLCEQGMLDVNSQNKDGNTPLHLAIMNKNQDLVTKLMDESANVNIKNSDKKTPEMLVNEEQYKDIKLEPPRSG